MIILVLTVTLIITVTSSHLSVGGGVVVIVPTLVCLAASRRQWAEAVWWLVGLILSQFFVPISWNLIVLLPLVAAALLWLRERFLTSQLGFLALATGVVFLPAFWLIGIRTTAALVSSLVIVCLTAGVELFFERHHQRRELYSP